MLKSLALILAAILIAVGGQFSLKYGVGQIGRIDGAAMASPVHLVLKVLLNKYVILGLGLYGLGAAVWIVVLSRVPLSFAYPMLGLSYVAVVLVSALFLHEHVTIVRWVGVFLIVAGVALVGQTHDDKAKVGGPGAPRLAGATATGETP
ncbi:MAG: hypothetical protein FJZ01_05970 [Candidatus Sericytochromatia bacterium]|nr:hypothetical protein [Candidatus Tanganyikabacteria bacterium]